MSTQLVIKAQNSNNRFTCPLCGGVYDPVPEYGPFWNGKPVCLVCGYEKDRYLTGMLDDWIWNYNETLSG